MLTVIRTNHKFAMLSWFVLMLVLLLFVLTTSPAAAQSATWVCTADKLQSYSYKGGKSATIHLKPYKSGGSYKVTQVSATEVKGKTKDGTPFVCKKQ